MSDISLTCDVCGRIVQGVTFVNGMKFCAKCYQETFENNTSKFVDMLHKEIYELQNENLKQQLAEKDKEIEELKDKLKRTEKAMHQEVKEHLEYYNADQKQLRHQVCETIRNKIEDMRNLELSSYKTLCEILNQVEGENDE